MTEAATKRVYLFHEGDKSLRDLLRHNLERGGKAA